MYRIWPIVLSLTLIALAVGGVRTVGASPDRGPAAVLGDFTTSSEYCADAEEQAFLTQVNSYRAQSGLAPLVFSQALSAAADHHSIDMASKNYFSHTLANGTTWDQNIRDHGYTFSTYLAENIAAGNGTAASTFTQWKNSSGHNANMLNGNYRAIGIGRAYSSASTYGWYWTTTFGGVVDAAATYCASAPTPTPTPTATPLPTATATPTTSVTVFVSAMSGAKAVAKSGAVTLTYKVTVKDTAGKLVGNAKVSLVITAPNGAAATVSATTTTKGVASISSKATAGPGNYIGKVTDIVVTGKPYNPTRNVATTVSVTV